MLLKAGADASLQNRKKQSAYDVAVRAGQKSCADLLNPAAAKAPEKTVKPVAPVPPKSASQSQDSEKNQKNDSDNLKS